MFFEFRERSSKDGMSHGSLVDYESQKDGENRTLHNRGRIVFLHGGFGSCQFLRGLWMDMSSEVTEIHMRIDAKNLRTTAGTFHLSEPTVTIYMISMLRQGSLFRKYS